MKYLGYYESLEAGGWKLHDSLEEAKAMWAFTTTVFEVPDDFDLENIPKPRFEKMKNIYDIVYSDSDKLIHEDG